MVPGKEGTIYISLIHARRSRQISTPLHLHASAWDRHIQRPVLPPDAKEGPLHTLYRRLEGMSCTLGKIIAQLDAGPEYTVKELAGQFVRSQSSDNFYSFADSLATRLQAAGQTKTASSYRCAAASLRTFRPGPVLALESIDAQLIEAYESWLKGRGVMRNTVSYYMRTLRAIYNKAVEEGLTVDNRPFRHVFTGNDQTRKRAVDRDVIRAMSRLDLRMKPALAFARDLFLLSFYMRGISFVDLAHLRKTDVRDGVLHYRRRKTGQLLAVRLEACMKRIIARYAPECAASKYLLPIIRTDNPRSDNVQYLNAIHNYNLQLRRLSRLLGPGVHLTSYVSRHTWATLARRSDIPISVISEGMGHNSELTTRIYLASLDQTVLDNANSRVIAGL